MTLSEAARAYVPALLALDGADPAGWTLAHAQYAAARHDLIVAAGYPCTQCDEGTCPEEPGFFSKSTRDVKTGDLL